MLPQLYAQDTLNELFQDGKPDQFYIEFNDEEFRFQFEPGSKSFQCRNARVDLHSMELQFYLNDVLVAPIKFGQQEASLKKFGVISCGDFSCNTALLGGRNGEVKFVDLEAGKQIDLKGHLVYTNLVKFFPSGVVGLSAGMDCKLKIWDLQTGELGQELMHQKGMVDEVEFIGNGRNLLSLCRADSSVVHFEVSKPTVVNEYRFDGVRCMCLDDEQRPFVGTKDSIELLNLNAGSMSVFLDEGAECIACKGPYLSFSNSAHKLTIINLESKSRLKEFESPTEIISLKTNKSKLLVHTSGPVYLIDYKSLNVEVLATDNKYSTVYDNEFYTLGGDIRRFVCN